MRPALPYVFPPRRTSLAGPFIDLRKNPFIASYVRTHLLTYERTGGSEQITRIYRCRRTDTTGSGNNYCASLVATAPPLGFANGEGVGGRSQ